MDSKEGDSSGVISYMYTSSTYCSLGYFRCGFIFMEFAQSVIARSVKFIQGWRVYFEGGVGTANIVYQLVN